MGGIITNSDWEILIWCIVIVCVCIGGFFYLEPIQKQIEHCESFSTNITEEITINCWARDRFSSRCYCKKETCEEIIGTGGTVANRCIEEDRYYIETDFGD